MHDEEGNVCGTCNFETLNLEPLTTAWRKALKEAAPITKIIFDLTPPMGPKTRGPAGRDEARQSQIHWDTDPPRRGGFCVPTNPVTRLVAALATATRMRAGAEVSFKIVVDGAQCPTDKVMEGLGKQMDALATFKPAR